MGLKTKAKTSGVQWHEDNDNYAEVMISVPWGHITGRWYGDQMVRPILALHGWLDNCGTFARLAPLLLDYGSVLCIDLPGHGRSSHLPVGMIYYDMEFVRAIVRLMDAYKWEKVSLMGHSMGGTVSFYFAALYPERVDVIITLDIFKQRHFAPPFIVGYYQLIMEKALVENERLLLQESTNEPPSYTFEELEQLLYESTQKSVALENCKYILERNVTPSKKYPSKFYFSRDGRIKHMAYLNPTGDLAAAMAMRVAQKQIPYLIILGEPNPINSGAPTVKEALETHNPLFEWHTIAGGTHHVHLNNPESVAPLIVEFLKKYRSLEKVKAEADAARKKQVHAKL